MSNNRSPPWSRDELILALDLYLSHRSALPSVKSIEVSELSGLLQKLGKSIRQGMPAYRNSNSVYMKLNNFRAIDPSYILEGKKGLARGGKEDAEVWKEYSELPEKVASLASSIRGALSEVASVNSQDVLDVEILDAPEGKVLSKLHLIRERSRKIVEVKKRRELKQNGALRCVACNFDFAGVYGERGVGYIEAHHTKPLHEIQPGEKTRLSDLVLLCSNCHRMVHARRPWLSVEALKALLNREAGKKG